MRYKRRARRKYPERIYARELLRRAVRAGRVVRQPCRCCGNPKSFAHHVDYRLPFAVDWLCRGCHLAEHAGNWRS